MGVNGSLDHPACGPSDLALCGSGPVDPALSGSGPADPELWLARKLGKSECIVIAKLDYTYNNNVMTSTCIQSDYIDPDKLEQAYRALIYNQPGFRAAVRREDPNNYLTTYFTPATDFSDVFEFIDQSGDDNGVTGYAGAWELAQEKLHICFSYESGVALNKCYLVKRPDCYILLNKHSHSIGDGLTSFFVLNEVLRQYDRLMKGLEVDLNPAPVMPSQDDMTAAMCQEKDELVKRMVINRVERLRTQEILLPMNKQEIAASQAGNPWVNKTLHAIGSKEGRCQLKTISRKLGVTVGSYSAAVLFYAVAAVHIRRKGGSFPVHGLPTQYLDLSADLRRRLQPNPGELFAYCSSRVPIATKIELGSTISDTAREIAGHLKTATDENQFVVFFKVNEALKTGPYTNEFASKPADEISEFKVSNQLVYNYPTKFTWGEVTSIHSLGTYYCPRVGNQLLLFHSVNGKMNYSMVCCDGEQNIRDAGEVFNLFIKVMENSEVMINEKTGVMDLV